MRGERALRGKDAAKKDCENKGCIFIQKNRSVDIEADAKRINCHQGHSHPYRVYRVKNDSAKNGYVTGHKMGYKSPTGHTRIKVVKGTKHKFNVKTHRYDATKATKNYNLYENCEDIKCDW
jgi:hypothetical protein